MSNSSEGEATEEEEEEFYESLDRVLSSSCSSTSASDDDGDYTYRRRSRFTPPSAASFDIWLSEPGSVEDRRHRLLHQMGLAGDPDLARAKPDGAGGAAGLNRAREVEIGRSISCDGLCPRPYSNFRATTSPGVIARSRSDGSVEPGLLRRQHPSFSGRPPLVGRSRPSVGGDIQVSDGYGDFGDGIGDGEEAHRCTVKDLETGKEFVVKEFRENGMWNKLREVGTGRQFTMEEFEMSVGSSPIVQELMRRQSVEERGSGSVSSVGSGGSGDRSKDKEGGGSSGGGGSKKRTSWLKSLKNIVAAGNRRDRRSSDEKDTSSEKGGRRSSSATDDSQDTPQSILHGPERMKVRHNGKSHKELSGLFLSQEIQAHEGSIWTIRFSLDGRYLASAGEDRVIHVWEVLAHERKQELLMDRAGEEVANGNGNLQKEMFSPSCMEGSHWEKKRKAKGPGGTKSVSSDHVMVPEQMFTLSERPYCSFIGHLDDVLDLSWSKTQHLLSSSMDKTVRLWHLSSNSCLKTFSHNDYVTCIQFNPIDDRYFISGSLDAKARIWSIPDRQVVDWNELHEMITAACYTPNGQGALVGSHEGNCYSYDSSDNKLLHKKQIDLQNKRKKSSEKKITGFQCAPGSSSEVLITSADSRIRVIDGSNLIHKFKGFRNTSSQISASLTANGKYVVCASEDSHVYVWRYDADTHPSRGRSVVNVTESYELFHCLDVTVAVPWSGGISVPGAAKVNDHNCTSNPNKNSDLLVEAGSQHCPISPSYRCIDVNPGMSHFGDRGSSTWPEEKLLSTAGKHSRRSSGDVTNGVLPTQSRLAWGMVIVTATQGGEIRIYQNFGLPVRV